MARVGDKMRNGDDRQEVRRRLLPRIFYTQLLLSRNEFYNVSEGLSTLYTGLRGGTRCPECPSSSGSRVSRVETEIDVTVGRPAGRKEREETCRGRGRPGFNPGREGPLGDGRREKGVFTCP